LALSAFELNANRSAGLRKAGNDLYLKIEARQPTPFAQRIRGAFIVVEIALTLALLTVRVCWFAASGDRQA
jgi:hypothetical protein